MVSISKGNSDISDFEGLTEEDLFENISVVPDSDPDSADIEVSSVGSSDISDLGEPEDETLNIANNDVNVPQEATWTTILGMSMLMLLNNLVAQIYLLALTQQLLYHSTILNCFSKQKCLAKLSTIQTIMLYSKEKIRTKNNDPEYADPRWSDTSVPEMKAFLGINILMGVSALPQYHLYWHKDKFMGNASVKDTMTLKKYEKLMQYLHVSDSTTEPTGQNHDKFYKIWPVLKMVQESFKAHYNPGKNQMVDDNVCASLTCTLAINRIPYMAWHIMLS